MNLWKCCTTKVQPDLKRQIYANHRNFDGSSIVHEKFCSNDIVTSRYTWYNFIPKNLFEQYHNIANIYYFLSALLYLFADGATSAFTIVAPVIVVLVITALKDGVDDILRHRRDRSLNNLEYKVLTMQQGFPQWVSTRAASICVGDVIQCYKQQAFPCDILILASSNLQGEVGVTTSNLDGEINTKKLLAVMNTQKTYLSISTDGLLNKVNNDVPALAKQLYAHVECQNPVDDLGTFEGRIFTTQSSDSDKAIALNVNNLALRGAKLADTDFIVGLVLYTGRDTKLSLNSQECRRKFSSRESRSNVILLSTFVTMITISIAFGIVGTLWVVHNKSTVWYISFANTTPWEFVQTVFRFSFIYNYLIPISNVITIELQQLMLAYFISNDIKMYEPNEDVKSRANNAQLADELGQIEYLFSDKTGTLTQNIMVMKLFAVLSTNKVYECDSPEEMDPQDDEDEYDSIHGDDKRIDIDSKMNESRTMGLTGRHPSNFEQCANDKVEEDPDEPMHDYSFSESDNEDEEGLINPTVRNLRSRFESFKKCKPDMDKEMREFLIVTALCHTVQSEHGKSSNSMYAKDDLPKRILNYEATSVDEKALVEGASRLGVVFAGQETNTKGNSSKFSFIDLWSYENNPNFNLPPDTNNTHPKSTFLQRQKYCVDAVLEFDSTRKRMTILARHPDGSCHIHSKGAEIAMLAAEACPHPDGGRRTLAMKYVTDFAINGLRTLVFSSRQVAPDEYDRLLKQLNDASGLVGEERIEAKRRVYKAIESDLQPIGVTGVEDRLQPGVKQCIQDLRAAGIQVWVLTGDMAETALTVSQSIGHIAPDMSLIQIKNCSNEQEAAASIFRSLEAIEVMNTDHKQGSIRSGMNPSESSDEIEQTAEEQDLTKFCLNTIHPSKGRLIRYLRERLKKYENGVHIKHRRRIQGLAGESIGLLIDGQSLRHSLHPSLRSAFLDLCLCASTVLCCRLTPLQKASIVQLVQIGLSKSGTSAIDGAGFRGNDAPITAAIGDGGNDVAMIQQASIGIGLFGKEGREASRAADYAIPQFRHLRRLLFVHGHWSYHRISFTMLLFYFKCTAFVTPQILLAFYTGFSQNASFGSIGFMLYNLTMTSVGCLFFGMFERHLSDRILYNRPYLYRKISKQSNLQGWFALVWVMEGVWQGIIVFHVMQYALAGGYYHGNAAFYQADSDHPGLFDYSLVGCATYVGICVSVNLRIVILTRDMTWIIFGGFMFGTLNIIIIMVYQLFADFGELEYLSFTKLACSPAFWFSLPIAVFIANIPALNWRIISDSWWTVQISLSQISQGHKRREIRKNWKTWLRALVNGKLEYKCAKHDGS